MPIEKKKLRVPVVGIGTHSLAASELDILDSLRVKHIRHTLYAYEEFTHDRADAIRYAVERGFSLLIVVHGVERMTLVDWIHWWDRVLDEVGTEVEAWQIGNEHPFFGNMATHCLWHTAAAREIRMAPGDFDALVVSMDLSRADYREAFQRLNPPTDAWAVHCYEYPNAPQIKRLANQLMRPLWLTEFSVTEASIPGDHAEGSGGWENVQATEVRNGLEAAGPAGYSRSYYYNLRTNEGVNLKPDEPVEKHGIVRLDGTLRPAAEVLRDYVKAR